MIKNFKKLSAVALMSTCLYLPQAQAAVTVDWVVLTAAIVAFFGADPIENDAVTDTSLRSVCIHALNGGYWSIGPDLDDPENPGNAIGFDLHMCLTQESEPKAETAFEKLCTKKLKYDYFGLSGPDVNGAFYICSEPVPQEEPTP